MFFSLCLSKKRLIWDPNPRRLPSLIRRPMPFCSSLSRKNKIGTPASPRASPPDSASDVLFPLPVKETVLSGPQRSPRLSLWGTRNPWLSPWAPRNPGNPKFSTPQHGNRVATAEAVAPRVSHQYQSTPQNGNRAATAEGLSPWAPQNPGNLKLAEG